MFLFTSPLQMQEYPSGSAVKVEHPFTSLQGVLSSEKLKLICHHFYFFALIFFLCFFTLLHKMTDQSAGFLKCKDFLR